MRESSMQAKRAAAAAVLSILPRRVPWRQQSGRRRRQSDTRFYADACNLHGARAARWTPASVDAAIERSREIPTASRCQPRGCRRHRSTVRPAGKRLYGDRYAGGERRCARGYLRGEYSSHRRGTINQPAAHRDSRDRRLYRQHGGRGPGRRRQTPARDGCGIRARQLEKRLPAARLGRARSHGH